MVLYCIILPFPVGVLPFKRIGQLFSFACFGISVTLIQVKQLSHHSYGGSATLGFMGLGCVPILVLSCPTVSCLAIPAVTSSEWVAVVGDLKSSNSLNANADTVLSPLVYSSHWLQNMVLFIPLTQAWGTILPTYSSYLCQQHGIISLAGTKYLALFVPLNPKTYHYSSHLHRTF